MRLFGLGLAGVAGLTAALTATTSFAEDVHGFDPTNFDGNMRSAERPAETVVDAIAAQTPRALGE